MKTWIKVERAKRDMTQEDLANALMVTRGTINSIECDRFQPSVILALRIAEYFGVSVNDIFILEDSDRPTQKGKPGQR